MEHIRHGFGERIPEDVSLQLVMSCGNKLVTPNIQEGQELNGMLIHKIFKTKALYLRPSRTLLADSEEEKYLSTAAGSADKDSDEDHCVIPAVTRSCVTTRAALRNTDPYPSSNNGEGIPGTGSDDADTNDPATSGRKRRRESQGVDGSPGTSSQTTGWLARDGNPGTSGYDYSSYLNLVSTLSQESSDDEEFNKAIIASMECQIAEKVPTKEILLELSSKINSNRQCKFNMNRSAVWEGATRGFQRLSYDPTSIIYVKFSDDMGRQEEGIDLGGPRREYLRLLMETIARSPMFEGKENCKSLALDSTALREDRFCEGMKTLGVLDEVRKHPDSFKPLFCYEEHLLSADQMDNLFIIQLSPEGSNTRTAEERVVTYWRDYLQDAEGFSD
ncbi:hypothetical protein NQZ68_016802 [Dissostichus eleginoides]|nr:hypothetical protein NQZ68_016802 [Dissostichus eleginoides]